MKNLPRVQFPPPTPAFAKASDQLETLGARAADAVSDELLFCFLIQRDAPQLRSIAEKAGIPEPKGVCYRVSR